MMRPKIIQVVGPTASGKTEFSVKLTEALGGELINVDSMQVYKPIAIGTDKPSPEQQKRVPIHGIDLIDFGPPMDASEFADYARQKIAEIQARGRCVVVSGGTGLYHRALIYGLIPAPSRNDEIRARLRAERDKVGIAAMYERLVKIDPAGAAKIYDTEWVRIERSLEVYEMTGRPLSEAQAEHGFKEELVERYAIGCTRPRQLLYEKIEKRLDEMWANGIMQETKTMLDAGLPVDQLPVKALGYKHAAMALLGECTSEEALSLAKRDTRHFAKRQLTWFRSDPAIHWIELPLSDDDFEQVLSDCKQFLKASVLADGQ